MVFVFGPYHCRVVRLLLYTVKIEVQQNFYLAHDFERSEKE